MSLLAAIGAYARRGPFPTHDAPPRYCSTTGGRQALRLCLAAAAAESCRMCRRRIAGLLRRRCPRAPSRPPRCPAGSSSGPPLPVWWCAKTTLDCETDGMLNKSQPTRGCRISQIMSATAMVPLHMVDTVPPPLANSSKQPLHCVKQGPSCSPPV